MWISKKELDALLNKAYLSGYELGKKSGELEGILSTYTPNDIRRIIGLDPLTPPPERRPK